MAAHLGHFIVNSAELVICHFDQSCQQMYSPLEILSDFRATLVACIMRNL
jgi:hypothetical protein